MSLPFPASLTDEVLATLSIGERNERLDAWDEDAEGWYEQQAELAAEMRYERWLEDAGSRLDPGGYEHDREMEAREGVWV